MDRELEAHEIEQVQARLAERFPQLDRDVIEAAVRLAHSEMTGDIREFVPVLVEHNARDRLEAIAAQDAPEAAASETAASEARADDARDGG